MKTSLRLGLSGCSGRLVVLAGCVALSSFAHAQGPQTLSHDTKQVGYSQPPDIAGKPNAALAYTKVWKETPRELILKMSNESDPGNDEALRDNQAVVESLLSAVEITECDWGLDYEAGFEMLLPELGQMRSTARILVYDSIRLLDDADALKNETNQQKAARRLTGLWRMPAHIANDRVLISSLVGIAIAALGEDRATELMQDQKLSVSSAQSILNAVREFSNRGDDPFGTRGSVLGEKEIFLGWVRREYSTGADAGERLLAKLAGEEINPTLKTRIASMNGEQIAAEMDRLEPYYDLALEAWNKPNPEGKAALEKLGQSVSDGEYGALGTVLLPSFTKVYASHSKGMRELKTFKKTLETYIANGGKLPEEPDTDATQTAPTQK